MRKTFFTLISIFIVSVSFAQAPLPKDTFAFTTVKENKITPVKKSGKLQHLLVIFGIGILRIGITPYG